MGAQIEIKQTVGLSEAALAGSTLFLVADTPDVLYASCSSIPSGQLCEGSHSSRGADSLQGQGVPGIRLRTFL